MRTRWKVLTGLVGLVIAGILIWVSIVDCSGYRGPKEVIGIEDLLGEKMGSVSTSDTSVLDTAPVQGLKITLKGGEIE